jgi:hypothetical protein
MRVLLYRDKKVVGVFVRFRALVTAWVSGMGSGRTWPFVPGPDTKQVARLLNAAHRA